MNPLSAVQQLTSQIVVGSWETQDPPSSANQRNELLAKMRIKLKVYHKRVGSHLPWLLRRQRKSIDPAYSMKPDKKDLLSTRFDYHSAQLTGLSGNSCPTTFARLADMSVVSGRGPRMPANINGKGQTGYLGYVYLPRAKVIS